jgi:hypothetical protein
MCSTTYTCSRIQSCMIIVVVNYSCALPCMDVICTSSCLVQCGRYEINAERTRVKNQNNFCCQSKCMYVCMYKGWARNPALALRPSMIYFASPFN